MKDFNLKKYISNNPLTGRKRLINEAFEGMSGVGSVSVVGDTPKKSPHGWSGDEGQPEGVNTWIADIDRYPAVDGWKASWEYPGVIAWTHEDIADAQVLATPGWDGKGTPVEFQSDAGSTQMLKVLDQDEFASFKEYAAAVKPYLDIVADANDAGVPDSGGIEDAPHGEFQGVHEGSLKDVEESAAQFGAINNYSNHKKSSSEALDRMMGLSRQKDLDLFLKSAMNIAQDLDDEGFEQDDIVGFLTYFIELNLS